MRKQFEFEECLITDQMLEKIGFTYRDGAGENGYYRLYFGEKEPYKEMYEIIQADEADDGNYGYGPVKIYIPFHFLDKDWNTIYFFHELVEDIKRRCSDEFYEFFMVKCVEENLMFYVDSYFDWVKTLGLKTEHYPEIKNEELSKKELKSELHKIGLNITCPIIHRDKCNNYIKHDKEDSILMHSYLNVINKLFHSQRDENYRITKEVEEKVMEILKNFTNRY